MDEVAAECFSEKLATKVRLPAVLKEEKVTFIIPQRQSYSIVQSADIDNQLPYDKHS